MSETTEERWLTNADLAERYQVPLKTVIDWRHRGVGPKGVRLSGKHVRYAEAEVRAWERERAAEAS